MLVGVRIGGGGWGRGEVRVRGGEEWIVDVGFFPSASLLGNQGGLARRCGWMRWTGLLSFFGRWWSSDGEC